MVNGSVFHGLGATIEKARSHCFGKQTLFRKCKQTGKSFLLYLSVSTRGVIGQFCGPLPLQFAR